MCFDEDVMKKLEAKVEKLKNEMYQDENLRDPQDVTSEIEGKRIELQHKQRNRDKLKDDLK